jgi:hypothetical protein
MTVTVESSGTQTAVINTEHTLATPTTAKVFSLSVDTNAMVNGDVLELRINLKVLSGGTERLLFYAVFSHVQSEPIKCSVPVIAPFGATFTLKQTAGTGRNFDWAVLSL